MKENNEVWVLSVKTSLPEVSYGIENLKSTVTCYDTFEKARDAMRKILKEYAFSENEMFDGEGNIISFDDYISDLDDDVYEGCLKKEEMTKIQNALKNALSGKDTILDIAEGKYTDLFVTEVISDNSIRIFGDSEGPINGCDPVLFTNIFSMEEERDYYLYIDDMFYDTEASSELYVDLKKAKIE